MSILTDDRAQALQIGAVLLFGLLIILFTFWQAFVVPDQNEEVEFNHNQNVQEQMAELRSTIISMSGEQTPQSTTVALGVRYPSRILFANPPPSEGILETNNTVNPTVSVDFDNATAVDGSDPGVASFWNGANRSYNTGSFEYSPDYARLQDAPTTIYEHTILYNEFERLNNTIAVTDQTLIDGNRINLITLDGQFEESRSGRVSVDVNPVSTQSRSITVEPKNSSSPIKFTLPTRLSDSQWTEALDNEPAQVIDNGQNDSVVIRLAGDRYELKMTEVSIGTGASQPDPAYLAGVSGVGVDDDGTIPTDENRTVTVEARDTYNSPVSGLELKAETGTNVTGLEVSPSSARTDEEGQITFEIDTSDINPTNINGSENATVRIFADDPSDFEGSAGTDVEINVTIDPTLSQEPPLDVAWDIDAINSTSDFDCTISQSKCRINSSQSGKMEVDVTGPTSSGELQFAIANSETGEFVDENGDKTFSTNFDSGGATIKFEADNLAPNTFQETSLVVIGGGDTDEMILNVTSNLPDNLVHYYEANLDSRVEERITDIPDQNKSGDLTSLFNSVKIRDTSNSTFDGLKSYETNVDSGPPFTYGGDEIPAPWTMVAAINLEPQDGNPKPFYDQGGSGYVGGQGGLTFQQNGGSQHRFSPNGGGTPGDSILVNEDVSSPSQPAVVVVEADPSGNSLFRVNGNVKTKNLPVENFGDANVDFFKDGNDEIFESHVGEVALFDSEYTGSGEIAAYADRLEQKWGV